jgi:hypothetical protein
MLLQFIELKEKTLYICAFPLFVREEGDTYPSHHSSHHCNRKFQSYFLFSFDYLSLCPNLDLFLIGGINKDKCLIR